MKILHTSDWHLGRTLHGVDLHAEQRQFIERLVDLAREHQVVAVIVSGDVYDRAIPAVETVQLLSFALRELSQVTTVVLTSGNHDSASRLGFGADVMRESVRILSDASDVDRPVLVADGHLAIYGIPYLDPDAARPAFAVGDELPDRSHSGVLSAAMGRIKADLSARPAIKSIVMAHAFVIGAEPSDSERDISIGGVNSVSSKIFDGVDYVALGHLHGPQGVPVRGSTTVARYSGSPLAYSFSERHHSKSVAVVDLSADVPIVELQPTPVPRKLTELRGDVPWLLSDETRVHRDDWVKVVVTSSGIEPDFHARLREHFNHVLQISHEPVVATSTASAPLVAESMSPTAVALDFVEFATAVAADEMEAAVIDAAYQQVKAAEAAR